MHCFTPLLKRFSIGNSNSFQLPCCHLKYENSKSEKLEKKIIAPTSTYIKVKRLLKRTLRYVVVTQVFLIFGIFGYFETDESFLNYCG